MQKEAVLVEEPPVHCIAGIDVLGDGEVHEVDRRDDLHLAGCEIRLVEDAAHTAPVVGMRVRVNHRRDRQALAPV